MPVLFLAATAIAGGVEGRDALLTTRTLGLAGRSVGLAAAVTVTAVAVAVPTAIAVTRTDIPGRSFFRVALNLPLVIPSFLGAFALLSAFGPTGMLRDLLGVNRLPDLTGFWGSWIALSLFTYPYVLLPLAAALGDQDPALDEAALSLGLPRRKLFWRLTMPQARPAIMAGALMVSLYTLSDFGVPSIMRYDSFTRVIYDQYQFGSRNAAAALALGLVVLTMAVVAIQIRMRGPLRLASVAPGARRRRSPVSLGAWRWPASGAAALLAFLSLGVTVFVLGFWTIAGLGRGIPLGANFAGDIATATVRSLGISGVVAAAAIVAVFPVAIMIVRHPGRAARTVENMMWASHGLPGLVIALALVALAITYLRPLYQTLTLLVVALVLHFLPHALGASQAALGRLNPHYEEAARSLGHSWARTLFAVTLPLLLRGLIAGAALVFLNVMKELPVTLLLKPIGFDTLAIRVWEPAIDGFYTKAGFAGLVLLAVASVPMAILVVPEWRRER